MTARRLDLLGIVEAGYRIELVETAWLAGIAEAARRVLDVGALGMLVLTYRLRDETLDLGGAAAVGMSSEAASAVLHCLQRTELGGAAADTTGHGVAVWLGGSPPAPVAGDRAGPWSRTLEHLATAFKLRRQLGTSGVIERDTVPRVFAALETSPRCAEPAQRAERMATSATAHEDLRNAAVAMDGGRRRLRRPRRGALELWRALTTGRWCVVDRFEADGRRYLLARLRDGGSARDAGLSAAERRVLVARAQGQALKLIAYDLGLSVSTVSRMLARGMAMLGLRSTAELAALFAPRP